jgi:hypothetical protein
MNRYSDAQIARWRMLAANPKRHLFWALPLAIWLLDFLPSLPEVLRTICGFAFLVMIIGIAVQQYPGHVLRTFDPVLAEWGALVAKSDPSTAIAVGFRLREGEVVHYSERGERCEERKTGQVINTQSRTKNAVGSAILGGVLFGPAGAIVGGSMARRQTTGTATDVYDVVPVDEGDVIVTNERFLFMGTRNTVDVRLADVMRFSAIQGSPRILVEYAGRAAGESYTVPPLLFAMCMARRARMDGFPTPPPPPPIPMSYAVQEEAIETTRQGMLS